MKEHFSKYFISCVYRIKIHYIWSISKSEYIFFVLFCFNLTNIIAGLQLRGTRLFVLIFLSTQHSKTEPVMKTIFSLSPLLINCFIFNSAIQIFPKEISSSSSPILLHLTCFHQITTIFSIKSLLKSTFTPFPS